jgi:hypothetical protein
MLNQAPGKNIHVWLQNLMIDFTFDIICIDCNHEQVEEE